MMPGDMHQNIHINTPPPPSPPGGQAQPPAWCVYTLHSCQDLAGANAVRIILSCALELGLRVASES